MDSHVNFEVAILCKPLLANVAPEWFFARMSSLMNFKSCRARVILAANFTGEGFLASMDEEVSLEMPFSNKSFIASFELANEWPLQSLLSTFFHVV